MKKNIKTNNKQPEKINRQEKFAQENFSGLIEMGDELLRIKKQVDIIWVKIKKSQDKNEKENLFSDIKPFNSSIENIISLLSIKMFTIISHAINGKSTKVLKYVIEFMDKYGIGNKIIEKLDYASLFPTLQRRFPINIHNQNLLYFFAIVAAQVDDIDFLTYLKEFALKNKNRPNIYDNIDITYRQFGYMQKLNGIEREYQIAVEALINGSEKIYNYYKQQGIDLNEQIFNNEPRILKTLNKKDIENIIKLEPSWIYLFCKDMPELLPDSITDIFIF